MEDIVYMITQLDKPYGFALGRRVFLLKDNPNYSKMVSRIFTDGSVKGMLTTSKKVFYS